MTSLPQQLQAITSERLRGMRRGLEKESLRALPNGSIALTPHPKALGSALTHEHITTDYSESQLELITGVHHTVDACLEQLRQIHQFTVRSLHEVGPEMLWASSMPCMLPTDETIPLARYGSSNVGRAKSVYRMGLGHRYGRRMQTISGIHYNWSLPGIDSEGYFALIRNFRRHAFLLLTLFGASPVVCSSFVQGREHQLQRLGHSGSLYMPYGTSLRMGPLGYQSQAQSTLAVSYNDLEGYAASLHEALTQPWPAYEALGIQNPGGDYNQLATTLLQIENEFYGSIRPKRVIYPCERPLHALRQRGVEYVEVRLMDLDPFELLGINASTLHFLDIFLLHCLLSPSPLDSPEEIREIGHNQHLTAARAREPGLCLQRQGREVPLRQWGLELLHELGPIAHAVDAAQGVSCHTQAIVRAVHAWNHPEQLPSARVLHAVRALHGDSFIGFGLAQSLQSHQTLLSLPWSASQQTHFEAATEQSLAKQRAIEAADTVPFETYRQQYTSPERLSPHTSSLDQPVASLDC